MEERKSKEDIEKILKSLEYMTEYILSEEVKPEEMIMVNEAIIKSNEEIIEILKEQNARWIDIYAQIKNSFCKVLIKNLTDKNSLSIKELEKNSKEAVKQIEKYKKML